MTSPEARREPVTTAAGDAPRDPWLVAKLGLMVIAMFGFGFALVPLYDVLCDVTGIGGRTNTEAAVVVEAPDVNRVVTIEFTGTVNESAPWQFRPVNPKIEVHPGKLYTVQFVAENMTDRDLIGQAVPSVAPGHAARFLQKTECFCFEQQNFEARERREMPVRFIIDPELPAHLDTLTLSYTFFDTTRLAASD